MPISKPCTHPGCPNLQPCRTHANRHLLGGSDAKRVITGRRLQVERKRLFAKQPACVLCLARGIIRYATVRDHIVPLSQGGEDIEANTQALCDSCNQAKGDRIMAITIISGPPLSGKTSYVRQHATPGDLIVDLDWIFAAISGLPLHTHSAALLPFAASARDAILERLRRASDVHAAWILTSDHKTGEALAKQFSGAVHLQITVDPSDLEERKRKRDAANTWPGFLKSDFKK